VAALTVAALTSVAAERRDRRTEGGTPAHVS
jgi:hypothetical protein